MQELIQRLFESSFMPHGHCYLWEPGLVWLQAGSNALIALAYFLIPVSLIWFIRERRDLAFKWMFGLFGLFILCCGLTHVMKIWTIWHGTYWLDGFLSLTTGLVSITTAVLLIPLVPKALQLPAPTELQKANRALEREIQQRKQAEAELAEAYEQLKETEQLKDEFFANVSHELRTPLTLILSPLETLLADRERAVSDRQRRLLETAHNNSTRMLQMVNGLLDFSRLEIGEVEVDRTPTDIAALTGGIWEDFRPLLKRRGLEGALDAAISHPVVNIDRYLYERILFNLLSNAVKFTPEGGNVRVSLSQKGDRLSVAVADTGIGIAEEELEHIFKDFRQIDASATRRFEGTGLGLPLVKEFAELLDGHVTVESVPDEGSTFTVRVKAPSSTEPPAVEEGDQSWTAAEQYDAAQTSVSAPVDEEDLPEIVLAEDNDEMAAYLTDLLSDRCVVHRARDGEEALSLTRELRPQLVITDIMMPGKDGLSVCRVLKSDAATTDIPVVMLTALTDREALLEGWEAGADEYLFKPFHPTEIVTRIQTLLTNVERRQAAEERVEEVQRELLRISEHERRRIGRDLHDGLASHMSGVSMLARSLLKQGNGEWAQNRKTVQQIVELAREGARQARAMARGLNPVKLGREGLAAALKTLTQAEGSRRDIACQFEELGDLPDLSEEVATNLYWIGQEALTNALTHGGAAHVHVRFGVVGTGVLLEVCDDGTGLRGPIEDLDGGMGVETMRYRADLIGARLMFEANADGGLCVRCCLPEPS